MAFILSLFVDNLVPYCQYIAGLNL